MVIPINKPQGFDAVAIVPSDIDALVQPGAALWVGTGGDINVVMVGGSTAVFKNVPDGTFMPIQVNKVLASGTTCEDIVAVY